MLLCMLRSPPGTQRSHRSGFEGALAHQLGAGCAGGQWIQLSGVIACKILSCASMHLRWPTCCQYTSYRLNNSCNRCRNLPTQRNATDHDLTALRHALVAADTAKTLHYYSHRIVCTLTSEEGIYEDGGHRGAAEAHLSAVYLLMWQLSQPHHQRARPAPGDYYPHPH